MERLLSLFLVKAHSLFYTTHLQERDCFGGAMKRNYQFLKVLQKMMCYHYRLFADMFMQFVYFSTAKHPN